MRKIQMDDGIASERQLLDQANTANDIDSSSKEECPQPPNRQQSRQCEKAKDDGNRCAAMALTGSRWCFFHDPAAADERAAASKRGGEKTRTAVLPRDTPDFPLDNAGDAAALLARAINLLLRGELDPKIANAAGYLLGIKMKAADMGKVEERIAALEAALKARGPAPTLFKLDDESEDV
jgi:hypothetical protein